MVTPSLHTSGVPHFFWISTDLDFGPSVSRTASASWVAPRSTFSRAADRNSTCFAAKSPPCRRSAIGDDRALALRQQAIDLLLCREPVLQFVARLEAA